MLFSTTTGVYSLLGNVSTSVFDDVWPYLILVIGIPLAFYIIEVLIGIFQSDKAKEKELYARADKAISETERLLKE